MKIKLTADGHRNASVQVSGFIPQGKDKFKIVHFDDRRIKLTSILFLIQEKAGLYLWWDGSDDNLITPLESRGVFKFDGLRGPEEWDGQIWASGFNHEVSKAFLLVLEFDK